MLLLYEFHSPDLDFFDQSLRLLILLLCASYSIYWQDLDVARLLCSYPPLLLSSCQLLSRLNRLWTLLCYHVPIALCCYLDAMLIGSCCVQVANQIWISFIRVHSFSYNCYVDRVILLCSCSCYLDHPTNNDSVIFSYFCINLLTFYFWTMVYLHIQVLNHAGYIFTFPSL